MRAISAVALLLLVGSCFAFFEGKSAVTNLTPDNFEDKVMKSDGLWIVEFYAPWCGHCKNLAPEWKKAAKSLKGSVHIAAVDADKYRDIGQKYGVEGFPTIKVFGADKSKPTEYEGGRTASAIIETALAEAKKMTNARLGIKDEEPKKEQKQQQQQQQPGGFYENSDVIELTDETFATDVLNPEGKGGWLVEFYAPWCGHCKSLAPDWKKAATALGGAVKIAAVDATVQKQAADKFKVQGFPTIKFFPPGGAEPEDYNGGRSADAIIAFCNEKAEKYPTAPPEVNQVASQEALTTLCEGKTLCVIFAIPHVIDTGAAGRNKMLDMFVSVASKLRSRGAAFGWIVGGDHTRFEEGFGIYSSYPTFIAFNPTNLRSAVHRGTFAEEAVIASIKKVLDGKTALSELKALPKMTKGVELWDGKDYTPPAEDEL